MQSKRAEHLDIVKALGIIAVVYGHAQGPLAIFVSLYHMALFFFVSGFFYKDIYTQTPFRLVRKRLKSLYVPFIAFGLFFGLLHNFLYSINVYSDNIESVYNRTVYFVSNREYLLNLAKILAFAKVEQILAPLWFLPVLFIVTMIFLLVNYVLYKTEPARKGIWLAVTMVIISCAGFFYYPKHNVFLRPISIAMVVSIMFYFGYVYKRYEQSIELNGGIALACFAILASGYRFGPIDTGGHIFVSLPFYLVCSLAGVYLNLFLATRIPEGTLFRKFLLYTGKNTITILALHFVAFRLVNYLQVVVRGLPVYLTASHPTLNTSGGWWVIYLVAGIALPLASRMIYDRLKFALFQRSASPDAA
jgi:fucose 4-O-acetylase-like acetyltransferase